MPTARHEELAESWFKHIKSEEVIQQGAQTLVLTYLIQVHDENTILLIWDRGLVGVCMWTTLNNVKDKKHRLQDFVLPVWHRTQQNDINE